MGAAQQVAAFSKAWGWSAGLPPHVASAVLLIPSLLLRDDLVGGGGGQSLRSALPSAGEELLRARSDRGAAMELPSQLWGGYVPCLRLALTL